VVAQQPDVARATDRSIGHLRDAVGIGQTARSETRQDGFEPVRLEADQTEIEIGGPELLELSAELLEIPARPVRKLIVGQAISALFFLALAARNNHRDRRHPRSWSCRDTPVSGE
jgi:hypothetical protein